MKMNMIGRANRWAGMIRLVSTVLIVASVLVLIRTLPVDRGIEALKEWVAEAGVWGPVVLGTAYIVAVLLFVPGSALSLAAGAIFGLKVGTITVSIASTTAAALAFLIARYLARAKIEQQAARFPKFGAIDEAIGQGGWRIIALLRLSPFVPFSLSNYLYGLTAIRFWPCVLASWVGMLPGTFMYIYFGTITGEGIAAAAGAQGGYSPARWAMLIVGLVATVAVTVYVTRLATRAIRSRTRINEPSDDTGSGGLRDEPSGAGETAVGSAGSSFPWASVATAVVAVLMMSTAACAYANRTRISGWFGPAPVPLTEAYADSKGTAVFDHSAFDRLLHKYVDDAGLVDYRGLAREAGKLDEYISAVGSAPFDDMARNERLALLINAYNAFTLRLILDHFPIGSIKDIPAAKRWDARRWRIGPLSVSLNEIEHKQIRPKFREPRIHFALVCAAVGCPKLRREAYRAADIAAQLEDQTKYVHAHDRWFRFDADKKTVFLTRLYKWYGGDFKQVAGSVVGFAARYSPALKRALDAGKKPKIKWLAYDWSLNIQDRRSESGR